LFECYFDSLSENIYKSSYIRSIPTYNKAFRLKIYIPSYT